MILARKGPRYLIYFDELVEAAASWRSYFHQTRVWIVVDIHRARLEGDEDYSLIFGSLWRRSGWLQNRRLSEREIVHDSFKKMDFPASEKQLASFLGRESIFNSTKSLAMEPDRSRKSPIPTGQPSLRNTLQHDQFDNIFSQSLHVAPFAHHGH